MEYIHLKYALIVARKAVVSFASINTTRDRSSMLKETLERGVAGFAASGARALKIVSSSSLDWKFKRSFA
ncbi:MAG: hypothetical protein QXX02_02410 [Candidatus Bathyarchaeia archaeon]